VGEITLKKVQMGPSCGSKQQIFGWICHPPEVACPLKKNRKNVFFSTQNWNPKKVIGTSRGLQEAQIRSQIKISPHFGSKAAILDNSKNL